LCGTAKLAARDRDGSEAAEETEAARLSMSALHPEADKWMEASVRQLSADFVAKGVDGFREE
jgi:hypothetical protein